MMSAVDVLLRMIHQFMILAHFAHIHINMKLALRMAIGVNLLCVYLFTIVRIVMSLISIFIFTVIGGPLQLKNWLIGVSSWEYSRAHRFPDGFTRLSEHVPWIIDQVDGNCEDSCSFVKTSEVLMFVKKK